MPTLPPQAEAVISKIDVFIAKYPNITQYGACEILERTCVCSGLWDVIRILKNDRWEWGK